MINKLIMLLFDQSPLECQHIFILPELEHSNDLIQVEPNSYLVSWSGGRCFQSRPSVVKDFFIITTVLNGIQPVVSRRYRDSFKHQNVDLDRNVEMQGVSHSQYRELDGRLAQVREPDRISFTHFNFVVPIDICKCSFTTRTDNGNGLHRIQS